MSGLWLEDEVLTLAKYCGKDCLYPIPFLGDFTQYGAEGVAWVLIIVGELLLFEKDN